MPFEGRTLLQAARQFCHHINSLLAATVTRMPVVPIEAEGQVNIAFRPQLLAHTVRLRTRFGGLDFYLGQICAGEERTRGRQRLYTLEYRYALSHPGAREPLVRWEYVRTPPAGDLWCRHHLQAPLVLRIHGHRVRLKDLHLPTGYVPFEEVLRFCIVDLGARALSEDWDRVLRETYDQFRTEFTQ